MKYTRLLIGLFVILFALWVIVGEQISGASANAYVNARLVTVRSTVAGTVEMAPRALGARIGEGEVVASVVDPLVDTVRLNDLLLEQEFLVSEVARLGDRKLAIDDALSALEDRVRIYSEHRIEELEVRLDHARRRVQILGGQDTDTAADTETAVDTQRPQQTTLALEEAREQVEVLTLSLDAARAGVFLGDGYNDAPFAGQRAVEIRAERAATDAAITDTAGRLEAVANRIVRERQRVNGLTGGELHAPVDGQLWEVIAADGENIQRGDAILDLVDCGSVMVSLSVSESVYNTLTLGQRAEFRLSGDTQVFDATVSRLAGSGAATVYRNLAVAPSQKHLERYDVTLLVDDLRDDPELSCAIGRTGRVFFDRRPLDVLRDWF